MGDGVYSVDFSSDLQCRGDDGRDSWASLAREKNSLDSFDLFPAPSGSDPLFPFGEDRAEHGLERSYARSVWSLLPVEA